MPYLGVLLILPTLMLLALVSCTTNERPPVGVCIPLEEYSEDFQNSLADEFEKLTPLGLPLTKQAIRDYSDLRQVVRAHCGE